MDIAPVSHSGQVLAAVPDTQSPQWLVENRELITAVKEINAADLFGDGTELSFSRDQDTKRPVIRVINRQTGQVLWQAPPEYVLQVARELRQYAAEH